MSTPEPRFVRVSRRAFLVRSAAVGSLVVLPGLACASRDEDAFATAASTTTTAAATSAPASTSTTAARSSTSTSTTEAPTTTRPGSGATFPAGGELIVDLTFAASTSGRVNNPYIAVWIEDPQGNLVDTISVWFQSGKGQKYLPDLRRWYAASDRAGDLTMSGATRVAGSYTVTWDGTDLDGAPVPAGDYVLHIEAAREHGPYELLSQDITIGDQPFQVTLTPNGELTAASAELVI